MPSNMGPPRDPPPSCGASSSSRKRKQLDEDEVLLKGGVLKEDPIENEYENLDNDDEDLDQEAALRKERSQFESVLRAQEPSTFSNYGDIKLTSFNLDEEKEEGEFDEMGNFIFRKKSPTNDELNDTWAESIDWDAVERREREAEERRDQRQASDERQEKESVKVNDPELTVSKDRFTCYRQMLRIMRPDETVQNTIRRLGNEVPKRRPMNKNKPKVAQQSSQPDTEADDNQAKVAEVRRKLDSMIELAHNLLEDGDTDIYQKSYENLEEAIN